MKLTQLMNEGEEKRPLSNEVKKHFLEIVSTYNKYQEMMDRKSDLATVAETLGGITEAARTLAIHEGDDWFDKHTIKRNMSELDKLGKEFDKCAKEATSLDQRLGGLYEDMGHILSRYYKMGDITEEQMKERLGMNESVGCGCGGTTESTCGCGTHTHESVNEGQLTVGDTIKIQSGTSLQKMNVTGDKWKVIKKDNSTYTLQKLGSSMKVRHPQTKVDYLIVRPGQSQLPFIVESVNESASKEAMGIAGFTGTRGSAVEDFITKNELNGKKLFNFIRKGSLKDRMDFVTAIAGNPGNPIQKKIIKMFGESVNEEKPGLWANIRAKQKRGEKPAHKNSQAHKDAVKAGKKINKEESVVSEAKFGYKDSTASYINNHKDEFKIAEKLNKGNEVKFYDALSQMEEKIGHPKFMIFLSNALRGYKVDMYKDPKIKNPQDAQEALFLLSK